MICLINSFDIVVVAGLSTDGLRYGDRSAVSIFFGRKGAKTFDFLGEV